MSDLWKLAWPGVRGLLPYPDLPRRIRMRRQAFKLITCKRWPGEDATGDDAAQLALLRLLRLQRLIRRAVRGRRTEEAALLARSAADACIIGLYCLHSGDAVTRLSAANNSAARRAAGYLTMDGLVSQAAIDAAADALGERGNDPNLRHVAEWLAKEKGLSIATALYTAYYLPLSHFFAHTNAFTLTRHVKPDNALRRHPTSPWARRSPVRLGDGCAGLMAAAIAERSGRPADFLLKYANAHLGRMLTPVFTLSARGWRQSIQWREAPTAMKAILALRQYTHGEGRGDDPAVQEARIREGFTKAFRMIVQDQDGALQMAIDEFVAKVVHAMNTPEDDRVPE
jgi:hypothetical protein